MKTIRIILLILIIIGIVLLCTQSLWVNPLVNFILQSEQPTNIIVQSQKVVTNTPPANTYGMSQYKDSAYGFSFWYPNALKVLSTITNDNTSFPGGVAVETLLVGDMGSTSVVVVNSPTSTITDEPANHASPIAQTRYFYDSSSGKWMVAFPQGLNGPGSGATTIANTSKTTISGLFMLPSGKRFDTTIVPLSTTRFLVISDGGGSSFTSELAQTVAQNGASIDAKTETAALQAEAAAYIPNE
jgi:hypothetical protein